MKNGELDANAGSESLDWERIYVAAALRRLGFEREAERYSRCRIITTTGASGSCNLRICDRCGRARQKRLRDRHSERFRRALLARQPGHRAMLLSVSMQSPPLTRDEVRRFANLFGALLRKFYPAAIGAGAFYLVEVGPENGSLHGHALVLGPYHDRQRLMSFWKRLTGVQSWVDIREVNVTQLDRVLGYITKVPQGEPDLLARCFAASRGIRQARTMGVLWPRPSRKPRSSRNRTLRNSARHGR